MWRESKKADAPYHPRRQLMVKGDDVYNMFLRWPEYLALKDELLREDSSFTDPGRTTFLSTRCGCLGEWMREGLGFRFGSEDVSGSEKVARIV